VIVRSGHGVEEAIKAVHDAGAA